MADASRGQSGVTPSMIAGFRCLEEIEVGVWRAIGSAATDHDEVILRLFDVRFSANGSASERYQEEIARLGGLDHPGLERVCAGGVLPDGRPWLVVDPLPGKWLPDILKHEPSSLAQRMGMVAEICAALQQAHGQSIVHGDLHAGRIRLVEDSAGVRPVITGFGASAAHSIGECGSVDFDQRNDVLAVARVLASMIIGPVACEGGLGSVRGKVMDAAGIGSEPRRVLLKALASDPGERYRTAGELEDDLRRLARHEPLRAGPATRRYHGGRFLRRHRVAMAVVASFGLALLVAVGFGWPSLRPSTPVSIAGSGSDGRIDRIVGINEEILGAIGPEVSSGTDNSIMVRVFGEALRLIDARSADHGSGEFDPEVEAMIRYTMGSAMTSIFSETLAIEQLRAAVKLFNRGGDEYDRYRLTAQAELASALVKLGEEGHAEADELLSATIRETQELHGPDGDETLVVKATLGQLRHDQGLHQESVGILEGLHGTQIRKYGSDDARTLTTASLLAKSYLALGASADQEESARGHFVRARDVVLGVLGERAYVSSKDWSPLDIMIRSNLREAHASLDEGVAAVRLGDIISDEVLDVLGPTNIAGLVIRRNNCVNRIVQGRPAEAEAGLLEAVNGFELRSDPRVHDAYRWLGIAQDVQGRPTEAIESWTRALAACDDQSRLLETQLIRLRDEQKAQGSEVDKRKMDSVHMSLDRYVEHGANLLKLISATERRRGRNVEASVAIREAGRRLASLVRSPASMRLRIDAEYWRIRLQDPAFTPAAGNDVLTIARNLETRRSELLGDDSWVPQRVDVLLAEAELMDRGGMSSYALQRARTAMNLLDQPIMIQGQWSALVDDVHAVHGRLADQTVAVQAEE